MNEREKRALAAFADGELSGAERARLQSRIDADSAVATELRRLETLAQGLRDGAHSDARPLRTDYLIASLRPGLSQVDAEIEASWSTSIRRWMGGVLRPAPVAAFVGVAAVMMLAWLPGGPPAGLLEGALPVATSTDVAVTGTGALELRAPAGVYEIASEDAPVMLFEAEDGSTIIWLLEEDDGLSWADSGGWA